MENKSNPSGSDAGKWGALSAVGLGVFMGTLDMSVVNISLPTLVGQLHTKFATIQWVVLGYGLVITSTMLGAARLGDMYEKKKLYNLGLVVFTIGSLLCGLSPNIGWLIAFRVIQGCGAVITQALGMAIIVEAFPPYERGRVLGLVGSIASIGISLGPAIGGLMIGWVGWRWIFLINVPIGVIAFWAAVRFLVARPPRQVNQSFDGAGALTLLITLCCFALAMTMGQNQGFKNGLVLMLLVVSVVGMILFLALAKRTKHPMVDLSLFRNTPFSLNLMIGFFAAVPMSGVFLIPFFLQLVLHYSPQQVGLIMMVTPVAVALIAPLSGMLSDRYGTRGISMTGLLILAGGCLAMSTINSDVGVLGYLLRVCPLGIGLGLFLSPNNSAIMGAAPPERLGVASGLLSLVRSLGQTIGMPIMGAIFTSTLLASAKMSALKDITAAPAEALVSGIASAYRIGAVLIFISLLLAMTAVWADKKRKANQSRQEESDIGPETLDLRLKDETEG
jgi:EmrB/QacA subfamily drug resistance transporter